MKRRLGGRVAMSSGWRWAGDDSFASWLARTHSERLSWGGFGERVREHARGRNNPQKKLPNSQLPELTEGEMQIRKIFLAAQSQELFSIYVRARKRERVKLGFSFCFSLLLLDSIAAASFFCLFFTSLTLFAFASLFYFSFFCDKCMNFFMRLVVVFFFISLQIHEKTALWVRRGRETTREGARVQALLPLPSLRLYICIWQNRSCSTAHIHVYMHSKRGGEQSVGHRKKYTGELLHDRDTASEGRSGHEERLYDRRTDATRLHLAHARKLARATKRRRVRRLSAFFYRNVCAKHKKALHIHSGWQCERERKRQRGRAQYTHTHTQAHAVAV